MSVRDHALLAPSAAARWVQCPGSVQLAARYPESDTEAAAEGTAAHWVFEQGFANGGNLPPEGTIAPNGVAVTEEMLEGAEMFIDVVGLDHGGHVETKVTMAQTIHPENWGTPDFHGLRGGDRGAILRIVDYKFGHRYVEEFENWQGIDYTAGVCEKFDIRPEHGTQVEITIVQPRFFGRQPRVRTWSTNVVELQPYFAKLRNAADMAMLDEAPCVPNDECEFCPGRHACEAAQDAAMSATDNAFSNLPLDLTPAQAGRELTALLRAQARINARLTGLQQQLLMTIRGGAAVPGWTIEQAEGRQKWKLPPDQVIAMAGLCGINVAKPGVITPKQAMQKGMPESIVAPISETPLGEWKLIKVDTSAARKVFGG